MPQWKVPLVLGEGGFGRVYKRFMDSESDQSFREWQVPTVELFSPLLCFALLEKNENGCRVP